MAIYTGTERRVSLVRPGLLQFKLRPNLCGSAGDMEAMLQRAADLLGPKGVTSGESQQIKSGLIAAEFPSGVLQMIGSNVFHNFKDIAFRQGTLPAIQQRQSNPVPPRAETYSALIGRLGDPQEVLGSRVDVLTKSAAYVARLALAHRRPNLQVIINTGELDPLGITHEALAKEIVASLSGDWHIASIAHILQNKRLCLPNKIAGLLVTGYSSLFLNGKESSADENTIQSSIRSEWYNRSTSTRLPLIILSENLPDKDFMNANLPWYNAPFNDESTFSISQLGTADNFAGLRLTWHHLGYDETSVTRNAWTEKKAFEYDLTSIYI